MLILLDNKRKTKIGYFVTEKFGTVVYFLNYRINIICFYIKGMDFKLGFKYLKNGKIYIFKVILKLEYLLYKNTFIFSCYYMYSHLD